MSLDDQVFLAFKLINTALAASFQARIEKRWNTYFTSSKAKENAKVIQDKMTRELKFKLKHHATDLEEIEAAFNYLRVLAEQHKIKLTKAKISGLLTDFSVTDYNHFQSFIYQTCNSETMFSLNFSHQRGKFVMSEICWALVNYLLTRNSLISPSSNSRFERIKTFIIEKESSFFLNGINTDFFVTDNHSICCTSGIKFICTHKTYLSTSSHRSKPECDLSRFELIALD
ncbi:hypothetical protein OCF84_21760 (plasmid) [Shewanella xiamenensis]|uniref:Uncharacterized protein n=1 Tax=Shewanella xiamenensis TaxID=332186 RepID=A0ABT6UDE9_9GAMM|nr:hypothetical protein [Shewanella xiamenensis]MDI5832494.1 hypothetical protein [Shewanella xiamenensis]WHF57887.1 hypothetical protein OCF84_21760 [Shewanella xiamenensis]